MCCTIGATGKYFGFCSYNLCAAPLSSNTHELMDADVLHHRLPTEADAKTIDDVCVGMVTRMEAKGAVSAKQDAKRKQAPATAWCVWY
jgi:hypothetical protein